MRRVHLVLLAASCLFPLSCGNDDASTRAPAAGAVHDAQPVAEKPGVIVEERPATIELDVPAVTPSSSSSTTTQQPAGPALSVAFVLPRLASAGVMSSRSMVAEAVYFASAQSGSLMLGQITRTGTVTVTQLGAQYTPKPADKLVVKVGDQVDEFEAIDAAGGGGAETAAGWLMAPHQLTYKHRRPGQGEATIHEQFDGRSFEAKVSGWAMLQGQRYDVDLVARSNTQGVSDFDGRESQTRYEVTGTVKGNGVDVDVHEQHASNFASATSIALLHSQRGFAEQVRSTITSTAKTGGDAYRFVDVHVESGAKEKGGQASSGVVATSGRILRNEKPFAECSLQNGVPVAVSGTTVIALAGPLR